MTSKQASHTVVFPQVRGYACTHCHPSMLITPTRVFVTSTLIYVLIPTHFFAAIVGDCCLAGGRGWG